MQPAPLSMRSHGNLRGMTLAPLWASGGFLSCPFGPMLEGVLRGAADFTFQKIGGTMKALIALCFLFSGATSLVYETLWIRMLSLGVGSTATSMSLVLSIFFFGLGLGSYFAGRFHHRIKNPLLFYGLIEGGIGLYGLLVYFPLFDFHLVLTFLPLSGTFSVLGIAAKFLLVSLFLLLPTVAMGATLPILVKILSNKESSAGKTVSLLYSLNTFGGVLGTLLTSFLLIPYLGVLKTNYATVITNLLIFGVATLIATRKSYALKNFSDKEDLEPELQTRRASSLSVRSFHPKHLTTEALLLVACGVCGFSSIAVEVVWTKYLGIFLGTNIYGLGLVLALFLSGIAIGSLLLSFFIEKIQNKERLFLLLLGLAVVATLASSFLLNWIPLGASIISYYVGKSISLLLVKSILTGILLLLPTVLFGSLLPLGITLLSEKRKDVTATTGVAYSINTFGSILGSFLSGLILIPWLGSNLTVKIGAMTLLMLLVLLTLRLEPNRRIRLGSYAASILLFGIIWGVGTIDFKNVIKSAYYQTTSQDLSLSQVTQYYAKDYEEFLQIYEGKSAIISLSHDPGDGQNYKDYFRLKTNGLNESIHYRVSSGTLPKYEALLGLLPFVSQKTPTSAFVVGFGGGYTVDFLTSMQIDRVYVAELEEGILDAAQYVYHGQNPTLKRPNLSLEIEDARYVLAGKLHGPYDIVVSQPSHSWLSGVANLFTRDFFEIVKENLTEAGVFSQWLNLYNMDQTILKSILKTFFSVFPHGAVFTDYKDEELIMIGSLQPIEFQIDKIEKLTQDPEMKRRLSEIPLNSVHDLFANFALSRTEVEALTTGAPLNTDENAFAEVRQSRLFYTKSDPSQKPQSFFGENYSGGFDQILSDQPSIDFYYETLISLVNKERYYKFYRLLKKYESLTQDRPEYAKDLGYLCYRSQRLDCSYKNYLRAMSTDPSSETLVSLIGATLSIRPPHEALALIEQYRNHTSKALQCYEVVAHVKNGSVEHSTNLVSKIIANKDQYLQECGNYLNRSLGFYYFEKANFDLARNYLEAYYREVPSDIETVERLISLFSAKGDRKNLSRFLDYYQKILDSKRQNAKDLADYYLSLGLSEDAIALQTHADTQ